MPSSCLYKIAHLATKRLLYKATVFRLEYDPKGVLGAALGPAQRDFLDSWARQGADGIIE
jgi:hypothetical protein